MIISVSTAWLAREIYLARLQQVAVADILKAGAEVTYFDERDSDGGLNSFQEAAILEWFRGMVGSDFLRSVYEVNFVNNSGTALEKMRGLRLNRILGLRMSSWPISNKELKKLPLSEMTNLRHLEVIGTRFCNETLEMVQELGTLENLITERWHLTDDGMVHIVRLSNLRRLALTDSDVSDEGLVYLKKLVKLERLYLENTRVTGCGFRGLKGLRRLNTLSLRGTRVHDSDVVHLLGFPKLERLNLENTSITDAAIEHISKIKLRELWLGRTRVTRVGIETLRRMLPECAIMMK